MLIDLGGWRTLHRLWFIFPRALRDAVYDWVALNRYKWFRGSAEVPIADAGRGARFLP
ncbi:MAG: DUF393 domain-containing protein [Flavobacteriales bacterium]|nr:DUF393 domain-containing protein [Flavobacteriales bacterium]